MIIVMKVIIILIILMIFVMVMVMTISYEVICPLAYAVSLILIPKLKKIQIKKYQIDKKISIYTYNLLLLVF